MLVVARTETALSRLLDVVSLLRQDRRIQIVFSTNPANPAVFRAGLDEHLAALGAQVIPWARATGTRLDLALSASENDDLAELDAPIVLFSHGLGHQKYYPGSDVIAGLNPAKLPRDGAVLALSHHEQRAQLPPEVAAHAVVVGDPTLDRLLAGRFRVEGYRGALDATGRTLVVLSSTWGPESLLAKHPDLPERIVGALPVDEFRVALLLHSGIWSGHGQWQVRAWLQRAVELGLLLVEPAGDWHAVLTAAHCLISDEGSLALYAAALDVPILLIEDTGAKTVTGSPLADLAKLAPRFDPDGDPAAQLAAAIDGHEPGRWAPVVARAVEQPSAEVLRPLLYRLLELSEPDDAPIMRPVDVPAPMPRRVASMVVGAVEDGLEVGLRRSTVAPELPLPHQHLVADVDLAPYRELTAASVLLVGGPRSRFSERADALLAQWPRAQLVAQCVDEATVWLADRHGVSVLWALRPPPGFDPALLASVAFVRRAQGRAVAGTDRLRVGRHVTGIRSRAS